MPSRSEEDVMISRHASSIGSDSADPWDDLGMTRTSEAIDGEAASDFLAPHVRV